MGSLKRWFLGGLVVVAACLGAYAAQARDTTVHIDQPIGPPGLQVIQSNADGLVLDLSIPTYTLSSTSLTIGTFDRLTLPDRDSYTAEPGHPQLPLYGAMIGVPPDARIDLQIVADDAVTMTGSYRLAPAPRPAPPVGDLQPGQMQDVIDNAAYASAALYPNQPARIIQDAWLRDLRTVRFEIYPFQYSPGNGTVIWHRKMRLVIHFYPTASSKAPTVSTADSGAFEPLLSSSLLNYAEAKDWRGQPPTMSKSAAQNPLALSATSASYRIVVDHDGLYRVTYADLLAAGLDMTHTNPSLFHLTSQEQAVAIYVFGEADGTFDPGDYIEFYGQKFYGGLLAARYAHESDTWPVFANGWQAHFNATMLEKYTDDNVYWLTVDSAPGPRMLTVDGTPHDTAPVPTNYTTTVHAEQTNIWWTTHFLTEDTWFWDQIQTSSSGASSSVTHTYTTTLSAVAAGALTATVRAEVLARNYNDNASPDHRTRFMLNSPGNLLEDAYWDGPTMHELVAPIAQSSLVSGSNSLYFNVINQPVMASDNIYFNWFEITYARLFQASNDSLLFSDNETGSRQYEIGNFLTNTINILDVSDPFMPERVLSGSVSSTGQPFTATFEISSSLPVTYFVAGSTAIQTPKSISRYVPPDLSGATNGADYIIITPGVFYTTAQVLANYRASQGLRVKVIDVNDLYNEFNDGIYHSIAIKNFLTYAYTNWQPPAPSYVVLVGDGHWNFKNYAFSYGGVPVPPSPIYMPPNLVWVDPWQGEIDSANLLAAVVADDILPQMYIGRVPVNSSAELATFISRTIAYEQAGPQSWQANLTFVADNVPDPKGAGDFVASSNNTISNYVPSSLQVDRIYENDYGCGFNVACPAVNRVITQTLNQTGTFLLNYVGHGAPSSWADESIFTVNNVPTLSNTNRLPIVLSMTCLDGYWDFPLTSTLSSLAETLIRANNGGAVATFSPTGLGVGTGHDTLQHGFYTAIFQNGVQRLGPATVAAKLALYASGSNFDLIDTFTVFGDPALELPTYALAVSPRSAARFGVPASIVTYSLSITNSGLLTDVLTVGALGNLWPTEVMSGITLPVGSSSNLVVSVTVPATATAASLDVVKINIASHGDSTSAAVVLTTTVTYKLFLPLIRK